MHHLPPPARRAQFPVCLCRLRQTRCQIPSHSACSFLVSSRGLNAIGAGFLVLAVRAAWRPWRWPLLCPQLLALASPSSSQLVLPSQEGRLRLWAGRLLCCSLARSRSSGAVTRLCSAPSSAQPSPSRGVVCMVMPACLRMDLGSSGVRQLHTAEPRLLTAPCARACWVFCFILISRFPGCARLFPACL